MTDFLIGRQQILDHKLNTFAYEILFRGKDFDLSIQESAASATNQVITDTILEIGLNELVGPHLAFINFTTRNILEKTPLVLPKDRIVVEVLENVKVDTQIIENLRELSALGYTIALDDFELSPEWVPLLEFCDIVKLDIMAYSLEETHRTIERLKPYKLKLLAEKVETHQEFKLLQDWGCELFQGFFFSKPNLVEGKRLDVSQTATIQLLATINKQDVTFQDVSRVIAQDVGLSYKLLRYINSASFALPNKIDSLQHATTYLGLKEMRRWVNILALSSMSSKSPALLQTILVRAKMCELLAAEIKQDPETYFMVGLLSGLDSILDIPLEKALQQLPLSNLVSDAILQKTGSAGEALQYALDYERWDINRPTFSNIKPKRIAGIYLESIQWWSTQVFPYIK
ncbi:EAL and HDOD domain-containing protein [Methylomonas methanica]|uniref:Diguanylate phosphodiesterase metal dependent hydrolase domain protein n=1 Tax=Methylomonas methanica (strain DSM 25384 / MC09) TaxID=857087 RepID=G0A2N5_METMM|nr:HDOD domain-containing protein [Methylomonas methanica]AEG01388.1 diguanylate phosphodiesterase metal dependent hydrolase domain protein [Methylomonas methanica MC09]